MSKGKRYAPSTVSERMKAGVSTANQLIRWPILPLVLLASLLPQPAFAYIGPGAGLGAISVALALVIGLLLLIVGLVWYPLKRLFKRKTRDAEARDEEHGS